MDSSTIIAIGVLIILVLACLANEAYAVHRRWLKVCDELHELAKKIEDYILYRLTEESEKEEDKPPKER